MLSLNYFKKISSGQVLCNVSDCNECTQLKENEQDRNDFYNLMKLGS